MDGHAAQPDTDANDPTFSIKRSQSAYHRHSLRVFKSNLNDTRVSLRLYRRNQRQIDCPD